jgi:hypothetical protein
VLGQPPLLRAKPFVESFYINVAQQHSIPVTSAARWALPVSERHSLNTLYSIARRLIIACNLSWVTGVLLGTTSGAEPGFWLDVPFVRQDRNLCGAASVSMVLQYWQKANPADSVFEVPSFPHIAAALGSAESKGVAGSQMRAYLASIGYQVFVFKGQWEDIKSHISKGRPLIVGLGNRGALDHYLVVTGWNDPENVVLVNDPARRKLLKLDRKDFQKAWERTSCWTLLALPPSPSPNQPTSDGR